MIPHDVPRDGTVPDEHALVEFLGGIFSEALGVPVAATDNFFTAGGDSISLVQVISLARKAGLRLAIDDVHAAPTARELACRVAQEAARP
jgi:aryl carrier-like protein